MTTAVTGARIVASAVLLAMPVAGHAAVPLTGTGYSTDFDNLISSGSSAVTGGVVQNGWQFLEAGTNANTSYSAGTGSDNAGNTYSFGAAGSSERAFGGLDSGNLQSTVGVVFNNATGGTITALSLNFLGEQWRNGATSPDRLVFSYNVGATGLGGTGWVAVSTLDILSLNNTTIGALNGNTTRAAYAGVLSGLNVANGGTIALRWAAFDADPGADDALAIDDFALTATLAGTPAVPEPATWAMMIGGFALVGGALRRRTKGVVLA